jgi:PhnB protein
MININPYFNFMGNTEEAMNFYKSVFGGTFTTFQRFRDIPGGEKMAPDEQNKIIHITLTTPSGHVFMATDFLESMGQSLVAGNNCRITLHTESNDESNQIFERLSLGANIEMPMNNTFWGAYCGMLTDRFGIQWMINFTLKN